MSLTVKTSPDLKRPNRTKWLSMCLSVSINDKIKITNRLWQVEDDITWGEVLDDLLLDGNLEPWKKSDTITIDVSTKRNSVDEDVFHPDFSEPVAVVSNFNKNLKYVKFKIQSFDARVEQDSDKAENRKNAFKILMSKSNELSKQPIKHPENGPRFTAKERLHNSIIDEFLAEKACFPNACTDSTVTRYVEVLTNSLWYISANHSSINSHAKIPQRFEKFAEYDDWRKKKRKKPQVSAKDLQRHSECLFDFINLPFCAQWGILKEDVVGLALALNSYAEYLNKANENQKTHDQQSTPSRQFDKDMWLSFVKKTENVSETYRTVDMMVGESADFVPVYLDYDRFNVKFENRMRRHRFVDELKLFYPLCILKYCPGGSFSSTVFIWKTPEDVKETILMSSAAQIVASLKPRILEFHTRAMRREFFRRYGHLSGITIPPHILRSIYSDITLDASAFQNPGIDGRVRLAVLGEDTDLVVDQRHLNPGRPADTFDVFFEQLEKEVQDLMAADERRHNVEHLAKYISVRDLINQTKDKIPEGVPIPSEATVLFAFVPRNSHNSVSKLYKGMIPLRLKVQSRQLRASHIDDHYCAALFRYMREYAVKHREDVRFVCLDDKAKVDYGEPGMMTSSGVRGKKSIVPMNSTLACLDHDMQTKGSITPSVCLDVEVPEEIDSSFYRGQVTVVLKDYFSLAVLFDIWLNFRIFWNKEESLILKFS